MKHSNLNLAAAAVIAVVGMTGFHAEAATVQRPANRLDKMLSTPRPAREFRGVKPWNNPGAELTAKMKADRTGKMKSAAKEPAVSFSALNNYDFIEGPDGTTWFCTADYDYKTVEFEGGYTEKQISGYTFHIYDNTFKKVGTIHDVVRFGENETRVASATLDAAVTKKFFNYDDKIEVMVYLALNTGPEFGYQMHYRNNVYSIGGEKDADGNDVCIAVVEGRCVDAVNTATDEWSENFYLTFAEDIVPNFADYPDDYLGFIQNYKTRLVTYKKAGWSGGFEPVFEKEIALVNYPGDTTDGIYFISKAVGNTVYFFYSMYEKPYFLDPTGFADNENATPDNSFVVEAYSYNGYEMSEVSTTKIPVEIETSASSVNYTFYSIGALAWHDDIDMSVNGTPSAPAYIVTRDFTTAANLEDISTDYVIFDNAGNEVAALAESTDGVFMLGNIPGAEPQALFVNIVNNQYILNFVDIYSARTVLTLPQTIEGENLTVTGNRVAIGSGKYKYAFSLLNDTRDADGNQLIGVAWINADGTLDRIDRINVGQNVARALLNMDPAVLTPFVYDTDTEIEYTVLVGRYTGVGSNVTEEFMVVDNDGTAMATFGPDAVKGAPYYYTVVPSSDKYRLHMIYQKEFTEYYIDIYELPLVLMSGGEGTLENPYEITSVGDLQMIKANPEAHYVVTKDFDASGYDFIPVEAFTGTLDGQNHHIAGLTIDAGSTYSGLFGILEAGSKVSNLVLVDPAVNFGQSAATGVLAGWQRESVVDNVKVYNLVAESDTYSGSFGSLIGQSSAFSTVQNSGVFGSTISLPEASNVGGIVGRGQTGLKALACAFQGAITGDTNVGGIVGSTTTTDQVVNDCHVDADITARNTVGGIVGSAARHEVARCYVEGTITATEAPAWGNGYCAGGVIGALDVDWEKTERVIVSGNIVALKSISVPETTFQEEFPGQKNSVHRIVGASSLNDADIDGYDSDWNPVYGNPFPELGLGENLALASLAPIDSDTETTAASTEGETIDAIDRQLLDTRLGWKFGNDVESPWHRDSDSSPWLHFEASFVVTPGAMLVEENSKFNLTVRFTGNEEITLDQIAADFLCDYDNTVIEMTGNVSVSDNILAIEFDALNIGQTAVTVTIAGHTSSGIVTVVEQGSLGQDSVADITPDTAAITFDGRNVNAPGARIQLYTTAGVKVAHDRDSLSVENIAKGIYIAVATTDNGSRSTLKIAIR